MKISKKQYEALKVLQSKNPAELIFGGGAGGGKSVLGCFFILKQCLKYPGTRWVIGRAKLKTLKETTLKSFFEVCKFQGVKPNVHFVYNQQSGSIRFSNGSEILLKDLFLYPSDPEFDELGSLEITGFFIDEVNQIVEKAWNVLSSRIRYKLDEYNLSPKTLGSCNPSKGWVYREFYKPYKENKLKEGRHFIQALVQDNPRISKHYIANLQKLDKNSKERLLYGNWEYDDDPAKLFEYDDIQNLFTNPVKPDPKNKKLIVDVARLGKDKTMVGYWEGLVLKKVFTYSKQDLKTTTDKIINTSENLEVKRSEIMVDEDGVGGGVVDNIVGCKGFVNNSSPLTVNGNKTNFANLKTQCYFELAKYTKEGKIKVEVEDLEIRKMVEEELEQIKQTDIDKDGKIKLVSKDIIKANIGRSPDIADMLMMRMWYELRPNVNILESLDLPDSYFS